MKIEASGVCHSDLSLARGYYPDIPIPIVHGHEGAGTVVQVGENVESLKKCDKIFTICGLRTLSPIGLRPVKVF